MLGLYLKPVQFPKMHVTLSLLYVDVLRVAAKLFLFCSQVSSSFLIFLKFSYQRAFKSRHFRQISSAGATMNFNEFSRHTQDLRPFPATGSSRHSPPIQSALCSHSEPTWSRKNCICCCCCCTAEKISKSGVIWRKIKRNEKGMKTSVLSLSYQ